tara:strand:- start:3994 stop:4464 length:471 start_codon:yes stop_codon:yes gene_type:complete
MASSVSIQEEVFEIGFETEELLNNKLGQMEDIGAIVTFTGRVRGKEKRTKINALELQHYPGMTEKEIFKIVEKAEKRWSIKKARVIHRVGKLLPGELIVFVGVLSSHRKAAFYSCSFIMDYLKIQAPFWKKEYTETGHRWVESRAEDYLAADTWKN